jgi:hypothetical protein
MRSAFYYPHTEVQSKDLLASSLLLWDEIRTIVPFDGYRPDYDDRESAEAWELIGKVHCPNEDEKKQAHELVEDFATRPLPRAFSYKSVQDPNEIYEVYPQKLLPDTWRILNQAGLAGAPLGNADYPLAPPSGLTLMSLLADCCAGTLFSRITDREVAYAGIAGLLTDANPGIQPQQEHIHLVAAPIKVIDPQQISFKRLLELRKKEQASPSGQALRDLRHRYVDRLEAQARRLAGLTSETDKKECERQFGEDMSDDWRALKQELKLEALATFATKEFLTTLTTSALTLGAALLPAAQPVMGVVGITGTIVTIGGIVGTTSKFERSRRKILQDHPMAYLYEASGGIRL